MKLVYTIAEILEVYGPLPVALKDRLLAEPDLDKLCHWVKLAAKSEGLNDFMQKIYTT